MPDFPRYAIYYAPPADSHLHRFGSALLGYDAYTGAELPFPSDVMPDWRELTQDPRKYGFHATLKAPLVLAPGKSEDELVLACASFAATPRDIPTIAPVVDSISGFVAIVPSVASASLDQLASDCVEQFDAFRAPLTADDRARRRPSALSDRQRDHLDRWGYPYVLDEFRFHMTLTGWLDARSRELARARLRERFCHLSIGELRIDRIALFRQQEAQARFRVIGHWPLTE